MKQYKTVSKRACAEFCEKKSVFISNVTPVSDEEQAVGFIREIKAKYPDATHNVYAYILEGTEIARFSDDGEPQGTAGMPVLEVIKREGLCGIALVVTRYFGGILLGAGGLVRAYAKSAKLALDEAGIAFYLPFTEFKLTVTYPEYEKLSRELSHHKVLCDKVDYADRVTLFLAVKSEEFPVFSEFVNNMTAGKAAIEVIGERYDSFR